MRSSVAFQSFSLADGRVFLVDLTANPPTIRQRSIPLPAPPQLDALEDADLIKLSQELLSTVEGAKGIGDGK